MQEVGCSRVVKFQSTEEKVNSSQSKEAPQNNIPNNFIANLVNNNPISKTNTAQTVNLQLEKELAMWNETFLELVQILTKAVPHPSIFIQTENDKRDVLKMLCESVTSKAVDPTSTKEYSLLQNKLVECQEKVNDLNKKCQQISEQLSAIPQQSPTNKEKEFLNSKIENLEEILKRQIKDRKSALLHEKTKGHKRKLRPDQLSDAASLHRRSSAKSLSINEIKDLTRTSSVSSFVFEQTPIMKPPTSDAPKKVGSLYNISEDENEFSNEIYS